MKRTKQFVILLLTLLFFAGGGEMKAQSATLLGPNLALGKSAKASSGDALLAVDGKTSTRWESEQNADPQTWQVDLGSSQTFHTIIIRWEAAYATDFTIEAGDEVDADGDLINGTTIATKAGQSLTGLDQTLNVPTTTARYIRFEGTARATDYGYSFWEFEVHGDLEAPDYVPSIKAVGTEGIKEVKAIYNQGNPNGFTFKPWSTENNTQITREAIGNNTIDLFSDFSYYGSDFDEAVNVADWDILHVDIFPMTEMGTIAIMPIKKGSGGKGQEFNVTPGQWNSLEIDLNDLGLTTETFDQLMFSGTVTNGGADVVGADGEQKFYVGNIYLYSLETPIPSSVKIYIKGEAVSGINMIDKNFGQGNLEVEVLDQNGRIMHGRNVTLSIVNSDSQASLVNTTVASGGNTAFQPNRWEGQTTVQGVDASGVTGYCYITCFDPGNNLVNENALHDGGTCDVIEWSSGGVENGIRTGEAVWEDGTTATYFGVDLKGYYDISAFQLMFDQGKFPTEYTIQVAQSGLDYEHAVWKDVYHYTPSKEVYVDNKYRCDVWNEQSNFTKAIRYIRFTSTSESGVTFKRFQVLGNYVSDAISDDEAPVVVSANASEITKNSAVLTMVGSDNSNGNLTYIITNKNTGLTHTVQAPTSTTIYVQAANAPALYAYKDDGTKLNGQDGTTMTTQENGYWKQTFNASPININFRSQPNNSSPTTPNINNLTGDNYFTYDGNTGYTRENVPSTVTVYVKAATAPYLYVWLDDDTKPNGAWPGTQLTQKSGEYWVYTYDADHINIQFNNGQSGDANKSWAVTGVSGESYFTYNGTNSHSSDNHATYALSNLQASTTYTYEVVAFDGINYSAPVNVTFTTLADNTAPTVVFASPDPVTHLLADGATLNFTGTDANNLPLTYIITNKNTGATVQTEGASGAAVVYEVSGLSPNTTYTFGVKAYNGTLFSGEVTTTFTTLKGGSNLEVWFTDKTHYTGWTGDLEDIITNSEKGSRDVLGVNEIHIKGSLNNEDVKLLRRMAGGSTYVGETNVKKRVLIKAENDPNVYAWVDGSNPVQELLGELPGTLITKKTDGYYEVEFTNTETVKIRINSQTTEFTLAEGNNYFTYDGTTYTQVVENNSYGILATLDLKEASFYHDGGVYMVAIENNNNNPISLELEYGAVVTKADIGNSMFRECSKLKNVILPDDCKIVGERAFYGGKVDDGISLESVTFPTGLERIEGFAFEKNEKLGQVTLPSSLTFIGYDAFRDCKAMTLGNENGQLPDNITTIRDWGFAGTSITEVILPHNAEYTKVEDSVFGWTKLKKVTIPNNVTTLVSSSFSTNPELEKIVFENDINNITEIGDGAFWSNTTLPSEYINRLIENLTVLNNNVFNSCLALETLDIPVSVTTLKDLTFANCTNLRRVTVNSATAPTGYTVTEGKMQNAEGNTTDPFAAVVANHMTLTFAGGAVDGYKSYRGGSEATVENNPFRRLLTKTLDEEKKSYDVAGQMHADVVLKRTMVEGWNTVALPFGVKADTGRDRDYTAAGVYKAAFNGTDAADDKFMIAAYRGIDTSNPEDNVFKFLKYSSYTTDPLDEFEPLLIRMGSDNISRSNNEYTFVDVDLNYDVEKNKLYRDGNADEEVPVQRWDTESGSFKPFIGSNYDHKWSQFKETTDGFAFTGTYSTKTTVDKEGDNFNYTRDYFIKPGDYIIQSNLFYKVLDSKKYGLKGFRAWFQKQEQDVTGTARPAQLKFSVVELDGDTPTEIDSFDAVDNDVKPFDVYSIGGQLLRKQTKSLNGLPNGIYIVNGRKVAVGK